MGIVHVVSLTLAQCQAPTSDGLAKKRKREKKVNEGFMSEVRTRRNISRAKQTELHLKSEIY